MNGSMSLSSRRELLEQTAKRYQEAGRLEKLQILDQFSAAAGYTRKHAITALNHPKAAERRPARRARRYDERVRQALVTVWQAANQICAKRLVPFLGELVASMERHGHLSLPEDVRARLLSLSPATADRLLAAERKKDPRGMSLTRPGGLLRKQIRVRTFADWDDVCPGFLEADLVAHCGERAEGSFLHTLTLVDVATGWTECLALLRRSEADVIGALNALRPRLPFPVLGLDTDNGSEFINYEMLRYCEREGITFTRSRAYKRNDQAHVEEKNGSVVRRLVGYDRYEGVRAWRELAGLYETLRLYLNFFQPSMKLLSKEREGARSKKRYDSARTPCQRLQMSGRLKGVGKEALERLVRDLDPLALLRELEGSQDRLWRYANIGAEPESFSRSGLQATPAFPASPSEVESGVAGPAGPRRYRRVKTPRAPRTWRTREDPFVGAWPELRLRLELNPAQTAKQLFEDLRSRQPGRFHGGQLRTLQRRVRDWRRQRLYADQMHLLSTASGAPFPWTAGAPTPEAP